jgi:lipoyl(octanoyl) transferase
LIRRLGIVNYEPVWRDMKQITVTRQSGDPDQLWLLQHPPVYTLGIAGRSEHLLRPARSIPVIRTDRGGQITYHGPGQIVVYTLVDLRRLGIGIRQLVRRLEQAVIDLLAGYEIEAHGRTEAPGVYVNESKVASLGLRVRNGCCYHGVALNVDMDLAPFSNIDPCGFRGLAVTQLRELGVGDDIETVGDKCLDALRSTLWPGSRETEDTEWTDNE